MKDMNRLLLAGTLSMLICAVLLMGTTFAWFYDSVENKGNTITAAGDFTESAGQQSAAPEDMEEQGISVTDETSLRNAIAGSDEGKTVITLTDNITLTDTITVADNQDITLQLNGKALAGEANESGSLIINEGSLSIADTESGSISLTGDDALTKLYTIENHGMLNITGGAVELAVPEMEGAAETEKESAAADRAAVYSTCADSERKAIVNMTDGTVTGSSAGGIIIDSNCETAAEFIEGNAVAEGEYMSQLNVSGGEIRGRHACGILVRNSENAANTVSVTITDGTVWGDDAPAIEIINGYAGDIVNMAISATEPAGLIMTELVAPEAGDPGMEPLMTELANGGNTIISIPDNIMSSEVSE